MSDAREIELWIKLHAALCKRKWFRHAMRFLSDKKEKALMEEAVRIIKRSGAFAGKISEQHGFVMPGQPYRPRDDDGWRIPRPRTLSWEIYELAKSGSTARDIAEFLGVKVINVAVLLHRMQHPQQTNIAARDWAENKNCVMAKKQGNDVSEKSFFERWSKVIREMPLKDLPRVGNTLSQTGLAIHWRISRSWIRSQGELVTLHGETWARMEFSNHRCAGYKLMVRDLIAKAG